MVDLHKWEAEENEKKDDVGRPHGSCQVLVDCLAVVVVQGNNGCRRGKDVQYKVCVGRWGGLYKVLRR